MPDPAHEALRAAYRPAEIRVLFCGESPPASGTFFYAANSNLWRYTQRAFEAAFDRHWVTGEAFLRFFQACGCYLDDLSLEPVNKMTPRERRQARTAAVPGFAERIRAYRPHAFVSVMTDTERAIREAMCQAGQGDHPLRVLPYPTFGNMHKYVRRLVETLGELRDTRLLIAPHPE